MSQHRIKKRDLDIFLQQIPDFKNPNASFEQYLTPAVIASDLLFFALEQQDIFDRTIIDLGCGTGIFAIGAKWLKAKKVIAVDIDEVALTQAKRFAEQHALSIIFEQRDISMCRHTADTVIMNPPFGAQKANRHADRMFLEKAVAIAPVIYSIHLTSTLPFIRKLLSALHATITDEKMYTFPLKASLPFHTKLVDHVTVSVLRIVHTTDA